MRGLVHQPAGARDGHMIRRPLIQPDLQKLPQTQRIRHPPRDASFALDPFKETDQHHPEVHPRSQRRAAQLLVIELAAAGLAELVEACLIQHFVQPPIERMARSFRQIPAIPQHLLPLTPPACAHCHTPNLTLDRLIAKWLNCSVLLRSSPEAEDGGRAFFCYSRFEHHRLWSVGVCYHNSRRRYLECPARRQSSEQPCGTLVRSRDGASAVADVELSRRKGMATE